MPELLANILAKVGVALLEALAVRLVQALVTAIFTPRTAAV